MEFMDTGLLAGNERNEMDLYEYEKSTLEHAGNIKAGCQLSD